VIQEETVGKRGRRKEGVDPRDAQISTVCIAEEKRKSDQQGEKRKKRRENS